MYVYSDSWRFESWWSIAIFNWTSNYELRHQRTWLDCSRQCSSWSFLCWQLSFSRSLSLDIFYCFLLLFGIVQFSKVCENQFGSFLVFVDIIDRYRRCYSHFWLRIGNWMWSMNRYRNHRHYHNCQHSIVSIANRRFYSLELGKWNKNSTYIYIYINKKELKTNQKMSGRRELMANYQRASGAANGYGSGNNYGTNVHTRSVDDVRCS